MIQMTVAALTESIKGLKAMSTLMPIPTYTSVSRLLWALSLWKLVIVPTMAQSHTKQNSVQPQ